MTALSSPWAMKCRISRSRGVSCGNGSGEVASRGVAKKLITRSAFRNEHRFSFRHSVQGALRVIAVGLFQRVAARGGPRSGVVVGVHG
jgi:hypothetical protein